MRNATLILVALLSFLLLVGCKGVDTSTAIIKTAQTNAQEVYKAVSRIEATTSKECLTDALTANLEGIKGQITSFTRQLESADTACKTEKAVLDEKITTRDVIIIALFVVILGLICLFWRKRG